MNLHRYKANFSSTNSEDLRYEFLGTWIMFAGLFLFIAHIVVDENIRNVTKLASLTIGLCYCLYWLTVYSRLVLGVFSILTFCVSLYLLQFGTTALTHCQIQLTESYGSWPSRFETPQQQFQACNDKALITLYYSVYIFSNFLVSFFYVLRLAKKGTTE